MIQYRKDDKLLVIEQDIDTESPREWDNLGKMVCFHKRYNLGDKHELKSRDFNGWNDLEKYLYHRRHARLVLPLYLYDHSGITMRTYSFNNRWDSGQVGFIYANKGNTKHLTDEQLENILIAEVKEYDQYLIGDIWGFTLYKITECDLGHEHKEAIDSCWGFYGYDFHDNGLLEHAGIEDIEDWREVK